MYEEKGHYIDVTSSDRRSYPRTEAHLLTVFRRSENNNKTSLPHIGYTRDISAGGVYLYTQSEVEQGENISLTIHFTADWAERGNPPTLEGEGTISRIERTRKSFPPIDIKGAAVQFKDELVVSL